MRSSTSWEPSKFELRDGRWRGSRDPRQLAVSSRTVADRSIRAYCHAIEKHARGTLLDLGCGRVPLYGVYRERVDHVVCCDWPATLHPSPHLDVAVDLNGQLPFADRSFDTVVLTDVLEHLFQPGQVLREVSRVLRDDGCAIIGVPFMYWLHEEPFDYYRYTEHALRRLCSGSGLDVVTLQPYGGGVDVLLDLAGKLSAGRRFGPAMTALLSPIGQRMHGRRERRTYRGPLPLGYLVVVRVAERAAG